MVKIITLLISVYTDDIPIIVHRFHQNTKALERLLSRLDITIRVRPRLDIKALMNLLEKSTFLLNNVIVRLTKIMNRADKN